MAKDTVTINPRYLEKVRALSRAKDHADITGDCLKRKKDLAIERGDAEEAIVAHDELVDAAIELKGAHAALWNFIYEAHPEISRNESWTLDIEDGTVEKKDIGESVGRALAQALSSRHR